VAVLQPNQKRVLLFEEAHKQQKSDRDVADRRAVGLESKYFKFDPEFLLSIASCFFPNREVAPLKLYNCLSSSYSSPYSPALGKFSPFGMSIFRSPSASDPGNPLRFS
jgi:hypothetical protein